MKKRLYVSTNLVNRYILQLMFYDKDGAALGVLNWYAVHPTSMNNTNHLISSDNKVEINIVNFT